MAAGTGERVARIAGIKRINAECKITQQSFNESMKMFQNYLDKKIIPDVATNEKILKLFGLYNKGIEVFGSVDAFS